ncbi:YbfB/YjiJ family MFS transporter [Nocardia sp. CDC159]|uniref:YbfB/YjiJ family MFS transporter n=1 Tax=Nocardia pulmonis TaxID=2951408 RepID=A0A9X2EEL0_9NOCA|nr:MULTISPECIES: YbfB/YjiJ family MFS transporter [Nocardia]MCM6776716.1 YbfB/YjiJ family MFS transporter [Nocardia pulmonis]MCM6789135.1 YbfB/YjiJ family MFS transporter [Nocardia sp. CDC159]
MTITLPRQHTLAPAVRASAGLAAAVGIGRFAYTPLMPVMVGAGRIGAQAGAVIAAANYAGYLIGAVALARRPEWVGRTTFRAAAGTLVLSEALMAWPAPAAVPAALRLIAGIASAVVFIGCAGIAVRHENRRRAAGIAFAGVGCGIALTGALALVFGPLVSWQALWLGAAALTALLLLPAANLEIVPGRRARAGATRSVGAWRALLIAYFLEGLGYIVIGTFLVAAVRDATLGTTVWVLVGLAAAPATVLWGVLARRRTPVHALVIALALQVCSALLPALSPGAITALVSAALFGATFMGITMLAIEIGDDLAGAGAAATLTAGYGLGQVLGPLVVTPVLGSSYAAAFAIAAVVLAAATGVALWIRTRT